MASKETLLTSALFGIFSIPRWSLYTILRKGKLISGWFVITLAVGCGIYICTGYDIDRAGTIYLLIVCAFILNLSLRILIGRGIWNNLLLILSTKKANN